MCMSAGVLLFGYVSINAFMSEKLKMKTVSFDSVLMLFFAL